MSVKNLVLALGVAAVVAGGVVLYRFDPVTTPLFPSCVLHHLTGLYCPGCGSTRAAHQLLHGHLTQAFRFNPLLILASPYLVWGLVRQICTFFNRPLPHRYAPAYVIWLVLALVLAYGILRNLPYAPFTYLAPPT